MYYNTKILFFSNGRQLTVLYLMHKVRTVFSHVHSFPFIYIGFYLPFCHQSLDIMKSFCSPSQLALFFTTKIIQFLQFSAVGIIARKKIDANKPSVAAFGIAKPGQLQKGGGNKPLCYPQWDTELSASRLNHLSPP